VLPIGIIVAVAIVCVVVAAVWSAQRADEVALRNERQLFTRALLNQGERVLREIGSVATSDGAYRNIRVSFDPDWAQISVGLRLQSLFEHDLVFVTDPSNHFLYASLGRRSVDPNWFNSVQSELQPVLDVMRGAADPGGAIAIDAGAVGARRAARLQLFLGRPAIVAAVAVAGSEEAPADVDAHAPVILSVKFIDEDVLAEAASRLGLSNLRYAADGAARPGDYVFNLADR
jgi:sensor domain CHASE-containing protein